MTLAFSAVAVVTFLLVPTIRTLNTWQPLDRSGALPKDWARTILLRDLAGRLASGVPGQPPLVLSGPTTSTDLTYYARIPTIGTLYWENREGLKRMAALLAEPDDQKLSRMLQEAGVKFLVFASWDDLTRANLYSGPPGCLSNIVDGNVPPPDWLTPLFYPIPEGFGLPSEWIRIYRINPEQKPAEAAYRRALYFLDVGDPAAALREVKDALSKDGSYQPAKALASELAR